MGASLHCAYGGRHQEERWPLRGAACVIEPDEIDRGGIGSLLRHMGFPTHEAGSGVLGEQIAKQIQLAVIVVNVMIKDIQALKLIERLRKHAPTAVIVALTSDARALALAHVAGADAVLASPPCGEALCATITEAFDLTHCYASAAHAPTFEAIAPTG